MLEPLVKRAFLTAFDEFVVEQLHPRPQESVSVIKLGYGPRLTGVRELPIVAGRLVCGDRDLMAADVVGVRVAAVLVVGRHHMRPEFAHHPHQRLGGHL